MPPPSNKSELETILGMVTYLSKFAPRLSEATDPLRQLLKENSEFVWDSNHDVAFQRVKDLLTQEPGPVLAYFDCTKDVKLQVDASQCGLGAVLLQDERPIAYASKALNDTEKNYAQIEKELFAVLFGCKRFHQYLYGRQVVVESDHKPLESIMRKPLVAAPLRLQRMILQLQRYNLDIQHKPGKHIPVADTLSRKPIECDSQTLCEGMDFQIHSVISNAPVSDRKMAEIRAATAQDEQLSRLKQMIQSDWPESRKRCPTTVAEYWNHRHEISEVDGILLKGEKIIIPHSLRTDMLSRIHTGHLGIEKSKQRARDVLFWPGMGKQIETLVGSCSICLERRHSHQREPMISHPIPERPWQVIATDLFTWNSRDYIVAVDYYSRYFEVEKIVSLTSAAVITKLKAMFARFGVPQTVISDNGPCYSSQEFKNFAHSWDFEHITSSPLYPQSNGLAEKTVQTVKALMDKAHAQRVDPYLSLLEYRNTPVDGLKSPAQLLMSRRLRSVLPAMEKQLQPVLSPRCTFQSRRQLFQSRQKQYYDRGARALPALSQGSTIRFQLPSGTWKPATVIGPAPTQRSYNIVTDEGQMLRRNRRHILQTQEPNPEKNASDTTKPASTETERLQHPNADPLEPEETSQLVSTRSGRIVRPRVVLDL
uniref:Gypsy retrotransposon integrase-like protein 1 n=1 Tax=Oryzias latipes TaxID=8090 RepID=A0A3P9MQF2_ORYLA